HLDRDTKLGAGNVWAKCNDCGVTFEQDRHEKIKESAQKFEAAVDVFRDIVNRGGQRVVSAKKAAKIATLKARLAELENE
ncbi:hypothetical protein, partial [Listeria monocytogenes]|uniref:hypothetical protein n=1 Tax=Listeria monocytogenes TaxID=1639 RepID=UPI002FDBDAF1